MKRIERTNPKLLLYFSNCIAKANFDLVTSYILILPKRKTFPPTCYPNRKVIKFSHTTQIHFSSTNAFKNPILTNGQQNPKTALPHDGSRHPLNTLFTEPIPFTFSNGSSINSATFAQQMPHSPNAIDCVASFPKICSCDMRAVGFCRTAKLHIFHTSMVFFSRIREHRIVRSGSASTCM